MSAATVVSFRDRVRWKDLTWVTWRQHRLMLVGTGALVLAAIAAMVVLAFVVSSRGTISMSGPTFTSLTEPAAQLTVGLSAFGALVAVFWTAPLVAKEYEQRTHLLAWSQDVSAARWLIGKTLVLTAVAVGYAVGLGIAGTTLVNEVDAAVLEDGLRFSPFEMPYFEAAVLPQVGYALFGVAVGLAVSAICKRTVLSMGLTLAIVFVLRLVVAAVARPYYRTPERITQPFDARASLPIPDNAMSVGAGYLDAAGTEVDYPLACSATTRAVGYDQCLRQHGVVSFYRAYQPADRLGTFQLIEFGLFTALAIALFLLTWRVARRVTRL